MLIAKKVPEIPRSSSEITKTHETESHHSPDHSRAVLPSGSGDQWLLHAGRHLTARPGLGSLGSKRR